jgi:pyruvate dehydrogenase E2 component (dihydrolipoamide acetyltransferase)
MPQWGMAMTEGKITSWLKKEGEPVQKGEPLFEVETSKITNTAEAVAGGILFQIIVPEGDTVPVGTVVGIIAAEGEIPDTVALSRSSGSSRPEISEEPLAAMQTEAPAKDVFVLATPAARRLAKESGVALDMVSGTGAGGRVTEPDVKNFDQQRPRQPKISSVARRIAEQSGLDVSTITGTGTRGKITKADVERVLTPESELPGDAHGGVTSLPYDGMRKGIGDNMLSSLQNAAQLTGFAEVDVTEMVRFRDMMREEYKQDKSVKLSYNDIFILAVSRALILHPIMNSTHLGDEILLHDSVNIGIAVSISEGLIVPVLRNAHQKGLLQIAREARELAARARAGTLSVEDVSDGTFTISNTGMIEIDGFTPILRPPETGILGIGRVKRKPAEYNDEIALRWMTVLSLTYNHCAVDGAPAHSFLAAVGRYLQKPYLMMS